MYDVITIGSATIDVFAAVSKKFKEINLGDKTLIKSISFETGGGGINSAVGLSRMGLKVAFLGKLGHDHNAFKILHELKKEKVKFIATLPSQYPTSYSFIIKSTQEKDRVLLAYKGASDYLGYNDFSKSELNTRWIYLATMLNKSFKTAKKIAKYAGKNNIRLMFNPSTYLASKGKLYLRPVLKYSTILVLNKSEAGLLLKEKSCRVTDLLKKLHKLGPKIVVITEGERGAAAYDGSSIYSLPAYHVKTISVTGAGDAFASGFLAGILHKNDITHALELGMANAASVIQYFGTKNKLLTYIHAKKFINKRKEKAVVRRLN